MKQFDPHTPNFSYAEVASLCAALPTGALRVLSAGPLECEDAEAPEDRCRACRALWEVTVGLDEAAAEAAVKLLEWHDDLGVSARFNEIVSKWLPARTVDNREPFGEVAEEVDDLHGRIAYARCSTLYALAAVELGARDAG